MGVDNIKMVMIRAMSCYVMCCCNETFNFVWKYQWLCCFPSSVFKTRNCTHWHHHWSTADAILPFSSVMFFGACNYCRWKSNCQYTIYFKRATHINTICHWSKWNQHKDLITLWKCKKGAQFSFSFSFLQNFYFHFKPHPLTQESRYFWCSAMGSVVHVGQCIYTHL